MSHLCANHSPFPILLTCLDSKCTQQRLCCLRCVDQQHTKHELISLPCFQQMMKDQLQINRSNPDKNAIIKELNKTKEDLLHKLQKMKNKIIGLIGTCEDRVEKYYSKIYHSFAVDSHQALVKELQMNFTSAKVTAFLEQMKEYDNITLGNFNQTKTVMYASMETFKAKLDETLATCQESIESLTASFACFTIAKPKDFLCKFSRERKSNSYLALSDCQESVTRISGVGGYPVCLLESPFNPINRSVVFSIDKLEGNKKSICLGVCLENVVKNSNFNNCGGGLNKGLYAIDQNNQYNSQQGSLASWNHHDATFNQPNVGSADLVGWRFTEGDKIRVEVDYYNSLVTFVKGASLQWDEDEEVEVYEMPIKLNFGPLHAFVSCQNKGDCVSIKM